MTRCPRILILSVSLLVVAVSLPCFATDGQATSASRPNVILIMADDVGRECFGCYGSKHYRTPEIDRLAAEGMRFAQCYAQPLCTPSRVKLMTGLSNVRNYSAFSVLNRDQRTIGQHFQAGGYETLIAGKWQLLGADHYPARFRGKGTWPKDAGFDHMCLWQVDRLGSRYWKPLLYVDGAGRQSDDPDQYGPEVVCDYILKFLEREHERPFFVYYPMILPHAPLEPTPDSKSRDSQNGQRNFEDMVAYMDKLVGRIARKTEELRIADNTLILFTGDNGSPRQITSQWNGGELRGGKGTTTEAGTRVPLVVRWPGTIAKGSTCDDLVDFSDFLPTLLEAAGLPVPDQLDGRSFLPQLRGQRGEPRPWLYCYYCPRPERTEPVRFAHDKQWKLYSDGRFYDVVEDPLERRPVDSDSLPAGAETARKKLRAAIDSFPAEGQTLLRFPR